MNLSNSTTMLARNHFDSAQSKYMSASKKIASGNKLTSKDLDLGGISTSMNLNSEKQKIYADKGIKISKEDFVKPSDYIPEKFKCDDDQLLPDNDPEFVEF